MSSYVNLFLESVFTQNLVLAMFLGICPFLALSRQLSTALGLGGAVIVVMTVTVPVNYLIQTYFVGAGALAWLGLPEIDLSFLSLVIFIGVIAAIVQILEMAFDRFFPALHAALGIFLPLIAVNCAILGAHHCSWSSVAIPLARVSSSASAAGSVGRLRSSHSRV